MYWKQILLKRDGSWQDRLASTRAELTQRMEGLSEASPDLRTLKRSAGKHLSVVFRLNPTTGRVRIDWALKPDTTGPLRVAGYVDEKLVFSDVGTNNVFSAQWPPGDYDCRVEACNPDAQDKPVDHVAYLLSIPRPEQQPVSGNPIKEAMEQVARDLENEEAVIGEWAEKWRRDGVLDGERLDRVRRLRQVAKLERERLSRERK